MVFLPLFKLLSIDAKIEGKRDAKRPHKCAAGGKKAQRIDKK